MKTGKLLGRMNFAIVLFLGMLLGGCGPEKPPALIQSAKEFIAKKDYSAASIQLKNALQQQEDGEARYLLAVSQIELGELVAAEAQLRKALDNRYSSDAVYLELARVMLGLGKFKELVADLEKVKITDAKTKSAIDSMRGEAYFALGQSEQARESFSAALASNPDDPRARVGAARGVAAGGNIPEAIKQVEEVLSKAPQQPQALSLYADLLLAQSKPEEAAKVLAALIKAAPFNGQARYALITLQVGSNKLDEAAAGIADMKKALPRDVRSKYLEGVLAFRKSQPALARDAVLQVLNVIPDHGPSMLLAAAAEYQLGSLSTAETYLRKVLTAHPDSAYARNMLVATYLRKDQPAKAEEVLAYALKKTPDDPAVLRAAGEVAFASNKYADAAKYYERALSGEKNSASMRTRLAQIRLASGESGRALEDLEMASGLDKQRFQADLSLISAHMSRKEYDKALLAVATLEKKQPDNPLTFATKGSVQIAKKDFKNARASLEKALSIQFNYLPAARILAGLDLADNNPSAAKGRFDTILIKEPGNEGALLSLADLQTNTKAPPKDVAATIERAIKSNPASAMPRVALVKFHIQNQDKKAAVTAAQEALASIPNDPAILESLGMAHLASGETGQAIETFGKLAALQPSSPLPLMRIAAAQSAAKQVDASIQTLKKALSLKPDLLEAQRQLIIVQLDAGRPDEALRETKVIQKARPKDGVGFAIEGEILASQKRFAEAAAAYAEGLKRQPSPELVVKLHQMLQTAGKSPEAAVVASKWLKENPDDTIVRFYLAGLVMQSKNYPDAARQYREILAKDPENFQVLNNLAWVLGELKDPSALGYAEKAYAKAPTNANVLDTYGLLLFNKGDVKRAVDILTQAVAADPKAIEPRLHLTKALLKSGDKAAAKKELENLVTQAPVGPIRTEVEQLLKSP